MCKFPCPCCGHLTLNERGEYSICPVCFWEDDGQDTPEADTYRGGPNRVSLTEGRRNYVDFGAAERKDHPHVRPPLPEEPQHRWFQVTDTGVLETIRITPLPCLPPYGPAPKRFSPEDWNQHSEGYVVKFRTARGEEWTGNFEGGWGGVSMVHRHPDGQQAVVVSTGQAYVVGPQGALVKEYLSGCIRFVLPSADAQALTLCDDTNITVLYADRTVWRPGRTSWDGMADLRMEGVVLFGKAYDPMTDEWRPFRADLTERQVHGGTWPGTQET